MAILVQKYGGSSVADVSKIGQVARRVVAAKAAGFDVVVVVSAMGKTTDGLLALAREAGSIVDAPMADPPRRELDMLVSTGERVSMALLSIALHALGCDAISFTGSQSGIITNDRHFDARIIEVRPHRIEDELAKGRVVIVAGYQGMSYRREITTLGRGGSDTTAVALAAALGATRCEIYSDVDGVYSADPRVVEKALHLPEIDLETMQEMAVAGAKVLNAQAVEWARRSKVAIVARRTADPSLVDGRPARETVAREFVEEERPRTRAVVGQADVELIEMPSACFSLFAQEASECRIPLFHASVTGNDARAVVLTGNVPDWATCRDRLARATHGSATFRGGLGMVSVVGDELSGGTGDGLSKLMAALSRASIATLWMTGSPLRLSAVIDQSRVEEAQRMVHEEFVGM